MKVESKKYQLVCNLLILKFYYINTFFHTQSFTSDYSVTDAVALIMLWEQLYIRLTSQFYL